MNLSCGHSQQTSSSFNYSNWWTVYSGSRPARPSRLARAASGRAAVAPRPSSMMNRAALCRTWGVSPLSSDVAVGAAIDGRGVALGFPHGKPALERPESPWGSPELF
jgi:hypothetical protein